MSKFVKMSSSRSFSIRLLTVNAFKKQETKPKVLMYLLQKVPINPVFSLWQFMSQLIQEALKSLFSFSN